MKSEEYYRVVSETPFEGFTVEERYKVVSETPSEGFTAEEFYKIIEGPEKADSLEDLDKAPEGQGSQTIPHQEVESEVKKYFKSLSIPNSSIRPNQPIPIGNDFGETDLDLYLEVKGKCIAIAEFKTGMNDANYGRRQLFSYLSATNTRFGVFANNLNADDWIFYENLRHFRFRRITRSQFEEEVKKNKYELPDKHLIFEDSKESPHQAIYAMEPSQPQTSEIQTSVGTYFSRILEQEEWGCRPENDKEVRINAKTVKTANFVLRGRDGSYVVIVEFRNVEFRDSEDSEFSQTSILNSLLCATDTRFGIIAVDSNPNKWKFYERLGSELPRKIEHSEFDRKVVSQVKEAACPVFKGDKISKEDWDKYSKTWNTLKSEKVWCVVKTYHPKCPLKIDEYISDDDYKRAQESYPRCPVKKDDILTKAELDEQHKTWPKLTTVKGWRVIEVFHSDCSFKVGQYISQVEYNQAQADYPGCPVKNGDILTKTEWEQFLTEAWPDVHIERVSWISEAEHQQIQEERDKYQSMVRRWQLIAAVTVFFFAFISLGIFSMHQNLMEDADTRNAVLAKQLTGKQFEVRQKESKIQDINSELQTLRNENAALKHQNSALQNQLKDNALLISNIPNQLRTLQEQLDEQKDDNHLSFIDKAMVEAYKLQKNGRIEEAVQKWCSIANIVDEADKNLAARAWSSAGYLLSGQERAEDAISAYDKAIEMRADYAEAYYRRGTQRISLKQYLPAMNDFDQAIKLNFNAATAYVGRGLARLELDKRDDAFIDFDHAISIDPNYASAYAVRGEAKVSENDIAGAKSDFQYALNLAEKQDKSELKITIEERLQELNEME